MPNLSDHKITAVWRDGDTFQRLEPASNPAH
jgi:hypothetical protein